MSPKPYTTILTKFPPNVPVALIAKYNTIATRYFHEGGYQRKLARELDINMKYLNDLLVKGIEPTSKTKKGREARKKLFLPEVEVLMGKEEIIEHLEQAVAKLQETIRRLKE